MQQHVLDLYFSEDGLRYIMGRYVVRPPIASCVPVGGVAFLGLLHPVRL